MHFYRFSQYNQPKYLNLITTWSNLPVTEMQPNYIDRESYYRESLFEQPFFITYGTK